VDFEELKRYLSIGLVLLVHSSVLNTPALSAPREGSKCTSVGKVSGKLTCVSLDGKKFWYEITLAKGVKKYAQINTDCYRENLITKGYDTSKKLVQLTCKYPTSVKGSELPKWVSLNGTGVTTESLGKSSPTSALTNSNLFLDDKTCRIIDGDPVLTNMTAGFPIPDGRIDLRQGANIQVIGIDFTDKKADFGSPKDQNEAISKGTNDFWISQSSVPVKINWNWYSKWITMPNPIKSYNMGGSFFEGKFNPDIYFNFARQIISQTDSEIDFKSVNLLILVFPKNVMSDEIGTFVVHTQGAYSTSEGVIYNLIMAGGNYANLDTYIHEFGHALGLTDIRDTTDLGNQKLDGMYFDTMNNPDYPELLVWHRFLLGFLEQNQIHCKTNSQESTHWLHPVAKNTKELKGLVIPLNSTEAIIVESRRPLNYDKKLISRQDLVGAVVYTLDSKVPYRRTPVRVVRVLKNQESVLSNGYKISVIESGDFGDVVNVEKVS
jgi:M6 family metalloprotease-like protein